MDNQHRKIKGYRELSEEEIAQMNDIKAVAEQVGELCKRLRVNTQIDPRWLSIGTTQLQEGFMFLTRAVARPDSF